MIKNRQELKKELYTPLYNVVSKDAYKDEFSVYFAGQQPSEMVPDKGTVRAMFQHTISKQDALGLIEGNKRSYLREGILTFQVLLPYGSLSKTNLFEDLIEEIVQAYQSQRSQSGIVFMGATPTELGTEQNNYIQTNIRVQFQYQQLQ